MTTWFVTRHHGAFEWMKQEGIQVDHCVDHFDINVLKQGDTVIGTLPINLVAEINQLGCSYRHLSLNIPKDLRGKELSADEMQRYGAKIENYEVKKIS